MKLFIKMSILMAGLLVILGSVGAYDMEHISMLQFFIQSAVGAALAAGMLYSINKEVEDKSHG